MGTSSVLRLLDVCQKLCSFLRGGRRSAALSLCSVTLKKKTEREET